MFLHFDAEGEFKSNDRIRIQTHFDRWKPTGLLYPDLRREHALKSKRDSQAQKLHVSAEHGVSPSYRAWLHLGCMINVRQVASRFAPLKRYSLKADRHYESCYKRTYLPSTESQYDIEEIQASALKHFQSTPLKGLCVACKRCMQP